MTSATRVKPRTIILLVIALGAGVAAALATSQMYRSHPPATNAPGTNSGDSDTGLTP